MKLIYQYCRLPGLNRKPMSLEVIKTNRNRNLTVENERSKIIFLFELVMLVTHTFFSDLLVPGERLKIHKKSAKIRLLRLHSGIELNICTTNSLFTAN